MEKGRADHRLRIMLSHLRHPVALDVVSFGLLGAGAGRVVASRVLAPVPHPFSAPGPGRWRPWRAPGPRMLANVSDVASLQHPPS